MSRKKRKKLKRKINPDLKFNSIVLTKFINKLMINGKKRKAENIVYKAIDNLESKIEENGLDGFLKVLNLVAPKMEVKSRRVGGATYQVPMQVPKDRAVALAMRWIIANARKRKSKQMVEKLSEELYDAYNETGAAIKQKIDTHKMAESNKAFAHFRF
ncbi:MAG: 30S ribosomal protein S7 [bacterium]